MVKCPKCGKGYLSTKRFKYITTEDKPLLVCPTCNEEKERESKKLALKTPTKPKGIGTKVVGGIFLFFFLGILCTIDGIVQIPHMIGVIAGFTLGIPMLLIGYFLLK